MWTEYDSNIINCFWTTIGQLNMKQTVKILFDFLKIKIGISIIIMDIYNIEARQFFSTIFYSFGNGIHLYYVNGVLQEYLMFD